MSAGPMFLSGVPINRGSLDLLARLPLHFDDVEPMALRSQRALINKGLASEEVEQLVSTPKGREVLAAWKARCNGAPATNPKPAAPAKPPRQGKDRTNPGARSTTVGTRGRREPSAAVPNGNYLTELRARLVAEHAAELAAIDKVLEIVSELPV